jgi:hypothetical protein
MELWFIEELFNTLELLFWGAYLLIFVLLSETLSVLFLFKAFYWEAKSFYFSK